MDTRPNNDERIPPRGKVSFNIETWRDQHGWTVDVMIRCLDADATNETQAYGLALVGLGRELSLRGLDPVEILRKPWEFDD